MKRMVQALAAAFAALFLGGCLPAIPFRTGKPIAEVQVKAIAPGMTTKGEILERFGDPAAVVARGEVAVVEAPRSWAAPDRPAFSYSFDADTFYELFPSAGEPDASRRIYYYRHVVSRKTIFFVLLAMYEHGWTTSDRLWVLVNEKTGIVEDYAFRTSGGPTVFGILRHQRPR